MTLTLLLELAGALAVVIAAVAFAMRKPPALPPAKQPSASPPADDRNKNVDDPFADLRAAKDAAEAAEAQKPPSSATPSMPATRKEDQTWSLGLSRARDGWQTRFGAIFGASKSLDVSLEAELEEALLTSDVGVSTTTALLTRLKQKLGKAALKDPEAVRAALRAEALQMVSLPGGPLRAAASGPTVVVMVGVNGVGKTTTIGKLTKQYKDAGKTVLLGAGDTFRAAAADQLEVWGGRLGAEVVRGAEGADPSSVAYTAVARAVKDGVDVLFLDTAGRLHTKQPLMDEMGKVHRAVSKSCPGAPHEVLLVLDATTGQNGLTQAKVFKEAVPLTGIVLTKLDGSAKGGIVLAIADELGVPVRYVGLGEGADDLVPFDAQNFVQALFGT